MRRLYLLLMLFQRGHENFLQDQIFKDLNLWLSYVMGWEQWAIITTPFQHTLKASARISAPFWLVRLERPTKNSRPGEKKSQASELYKCGHVTIHFAVTLQGLKTFNANNTASLWLNTAAAAVLSAYLWERPVVSMARHKQAPEWLARMPQHTELRDGLLM